MTLLVSCCVDDIFLLPNHIFWGKNPIKQPSASQKNGGVGVNIFIKTCPSIENS
jgi:hypothetical protein